MFDNSRRKKNFRKLSTLFLTDIEIVMHMIATSLKPNSLLNKPCSLFGVDKLLDNF